MQMVHCVRSAVARDHAFDCANDVMLSYSGKPMWLAHLPRMQDYEGMLRDYDLPLLSFRCPHFS